DTIIIALMTAVVATLPLFIGWFFFPVLFIFLSFLYRVATISSGSATWGMRLLNIELRNKEGATLETSEAVLHTAAYMVASSFFFPQVISIILMLITERGQGLHDMLCGTAAIRTPSRY
ncbi:MAG: RDD family protein, partial [Pseudomonadota bacterium]